MYYGIINPSSSALRTQKIIFLYPSQPVFSILPNGGGTSTNPRIGKQPQSFKDFIRVVFGQKGGDDATASDQINVLGSHYGSYDFKLSYTQKDWGGHFYYQHYFNDKSGMEFANKTDGLWGIQVDLPTIPWLNKIVAEYLVTMNQSGPMHFITFDRDKWKGGRGGGNGDYYNNGEYRTGFLILTVE